MGVKFKKLEEEILIITTKVLSVEDVISEKANRVTEQTTDGVERDLRGETLDAHIKEEVEELRERDMRKVNAIFFGLLEEKDETISTIMDWIRNNMELDIQVKSIMRIGRPGNKHRPLQIRMENVATRNLLLANAKELRKLEGDKVFVNPDYTRRERMEQQKLRAALREKRNNGGEWKIHRNKVVAVQVNKDANITELVKGPRQRETTTQSEKDGRGNEEEREQQKA